MIRLTIGLLLGAVLALPAQAQSIQGKWQYYFLSADGVNTGTMDIDSRGKAGAVGKVSGINVGYTQNGTASQQGATVNIVFTEAQVPGSSVRYSPDRFTCQFSSVNLMECRITDATGMSSSSGQLARAGSAEAASLGQKPRAVEGNYYVDLRTRCRLWTPYFHQDATVQWSGACKGGVAEGPGVLTVKHSIPDEQGDVEVRIEGQYIGGKLNGRTLVTYDDGSRFEGEMKDGIRHGHGRYTSPGKSYYDGDYRDGAWWGHGVMVFDKGCSTCDLPGSRYEGEFVNYKFQGAGIFTKANGDRYEGAWGNGLPNGPGTYTWDNGTKRYTGKWASGCSLSPQGRIYSFGTTQQDCEKFRDYLTRYVR